VRHAPERTILGALGVAFPVAMLTATLLFVARAVGSMTRVALAPVQVEQRALVTSLDVDATALARRLAAVTGVEHVDRFATADVVVRAPGVPGGSTARLFAIDQSYLRHHRWVRVVSGSLARGALLDQSLRDFMPAFRKARRVTIQIPGGGRPTLTLANAGTVDLRSALSTWFSIPTGDVQGDVALVPRAIVVPFAAFQHTLLRAFKTALGPTTPVLNPGLTDLPPVSVEAHVAIDHRAYPPDPGSAVVWSDALRHLLERRAPPGSIVVADNAAEPLTEASSDATNAKILFLLLGIPGALAAAALGLAAQSALAEAQRREDGLLRLRGATEADLVRLASAQAAVAACSGAALGLLAAFGAVSAVERDAAWHGVPGGSLALAVAAGVAIGAFTTGLRLLLLVRASRRVDVVAQRRLLERGWRPLWLRAHLDLVAIAIGLVILGVNLLSGGLRPSPVAASQAATLGLSFYVLLAPIALWVGLTLLAVRLLLAWSRRRTSLGRGGSLPSWPAAALRWLGRRPARTGVALTLGALAVAFGSEVVTFVATYGSAKQRDDAAAFGADLRIVPGDPLSTLPRLRDAVARVTPIREVPVRAGTDRKTVMAIDLRTYSQTVAVAPTITAGAGLDGLRRRRSGIVVAQEIAADLGVRPGDNLPLTVFPDDKDRSRNVNFHVVGVFRSFPPSDPYAEMVTSTAALPPYLLPRPDFYLARASKGTPAAAAAAALKALPGFRKRFAVGTLPQRAQTAPRSLTVLNLGGLKWIESVGAGLIGALGVALLAAFLVLERRRELAILQMVGATSSQALTAPALECVVAVVGSVLIGLPLGLLLSMLAVRVLGLFFALPPPVLSVPVATLALFVLAMVVASAVTVAGALRGIAHVGTVTMLREP
jgi:putative ABC transport system permease protein